MSDPGAITIVNSTRSRLQVMLNGRVVTVTGEGMPAGGPVDFFADLVSLRQWDDGEELSHDDRETIVNALPVAALKNGFKIVFD